MTLCALKCRVWHARVTSTNSSSSWSSLSALATECGKSCQLRLSRDEDGEPEPDLEGLAGSTSAAVAAAAGDIRAEAGVVVGEVTVRFMPEVTERSLGVMDEGGGGGLAGADGATMVTSPPSSLILESLDFFAVEEEEVCFVLFCFAASSFFFSSPAASVVAQVNFN